jgi:hypothetical protein
MASVLPDDRPVAQADPGARFGPPTLVAGTLHAYVAFDWGDEVDLERARALVPAEVHPLPRRRRTPTSVVYRPPPLRFHLAPVSLDLPEVGRLEAPGELTVFDFGAVSVALHVPFRQSADCLSRLAGWLAEPSPLLQVARAAVVPLHRQLLPAIHKPQWQDDLSEEYFVFHLPPGAPLPPPATLLESHAAWLAGLVRLESGPLSAEEVAEAVRLHLSYSPDDLLVPDWAAAVLVDCDCDETLHTLEFANLQLLELRHIDNRLDDSLAAAYRLISPLSRARLLGWSSHARSLRALGQLKVEANGLFERTGNVLKLVGDQYLARVYRLMARRFHLQEWEQSIRRTLEVDEGIYEVLANQAATYRTELLEVIVIVLILLEVVLAIFRH